MADDISTAEWSPSRELQIVAGTPPGGGLDRAARALAKAIETEGLASVPVRVVNVPGDGARAAWRYLDGYAGDGHVVSISSPNLTTDKLLGLASFDQRTYSPLAILYTEYIAFIARPDSRFANARAFKHALSEAASELKIGLSTTLGNPNHIAVAKVAQAVGVDVRTLRVTPFDTALAVVDDVIAGQSDVGAVTLASVVKAQQLGQVVTFAVSAGARLGGMFAATPAWHDVGVDCVIGAWRGVTGPTGLSSAQVHYWQSMLQAATDTATWRQVLDAYFWAPQYVAGTALESELEQERSNYATQLVSLGLIQRADK